MSDPSIAARALERRSPTRGDIRRRAILTALERLLADRPLADIGVADIAREAGVVRSGFYFYFASKATAVGALLTDLFDDMMAATRLWHDETDGEPRERIRTGLVRVVELWRGHANLVQAMLDAAHTDPEARALWDAWLDAFAQRAAAKIDEERVSGRAPGGIDALALATALVGMNERALARSLRSVPTEEEQAHSIDALVEIWWTAIYGARP